MPSIKAIESLEQKIRTPFLDSPETIMKLIASLKESKLQTNLRNVDRNGIVTSREKDITQSLSEAMAMISCADDFTDDYARGRKKHSSVWNISDEKYLRPKLNAMCGLYDIAQELCCTKADISRIDLFTDNSSYMRLFEIYRFIDLRAFLKLIHKGNTTALEDSFREMTEFVGPSKDSHYTVGKVLMSSLYNLYDILFIDDNGAVQRPFRYTADKIEDSRKEWWFISELFIEPLKDKITYDYYYYNDLQ